MWLFTHLGYGAVLWELVENFPLRKGELWRLARTGSITKARARVGQAPLRWLFDRVAGVRGTPATPGVFWRALRVMSLDGTCPGPPLLPYFAPGMLVTADRGFPSFPPPVA
jgi:hypothetical protein